MPDYMLRFFELTRRELKAIIAKETAGDWDEVAPDIKSSCLRLTGLDFDLIRRLSPEALYDLICKSADGNLKCKLLGELLIQYSNLCQHEQNIADKVGSCLQAYYLLSRSISTSNNDDVAYRSAIELLKMELSPFEDNPYVRERLITLS